MEINKEELIKKAHEAKEFAYVPYSHFKVGAALLTASGKIYTGCNIENLSYGATNCAERTAIFKAISEGEKDFIALAVVSSALDITYPCGICRQVMSEHLKNAILYFENSQGDIISHSVKEIMPFMFDNDFTTEKF